MIPILPSANDLWRFGSTTKKEQKYAHNYKSFRPSADNQKKVEINNKDRGRVGEAENKLVLAWRTSVDTISGSNVRTGRLREEENQYSVNSMCRRNQLTAIVFTEGNEPTRVRGGRDGE